MTYIHLPGDPQGRPPYLGRDVLMQGGLIAADPGRLVALCNLTLNGVDPDLHFQAVGDRVLYAALYAARMSSDHPQDRLFGSVPEIDIGLWVLTWGGRRGKPFQLRWMPAFIFVDSPSALMTGRELYGYPKQFGRMIRRGVADGDFSVVLRAIGFQNQDPKESGREHEVLRVGPGPGGGGGAQKEPDMRPLLEALRGAIDDNGDWADALSSLAPPFFGMPMVFLRQMRDVTKMDDAMVKEVATVTVAPTHLASAGLADKHHCDLASLASFPIQQTLGCALSADIDPAFWVNFDFEVGSGQRL